MYFTWEDNTLIVLVAWVDVAMILGPHVMVKKAQQKLQTAVTCKHERVLMEYVGSKITMHHNNSSLGPIKFTQPVLVRKLWEEYGPKDGPASWLPSVAGQVFMKGDGDGTMNDTESMMTRLQLQPAGT